MPAYKLLSVSTDHKTVKGEQFGVLTGILYLAPADVSGYEVCPKSTEGCRNSCLYTAGRGAMPNVMKGRIRKTKLFFENRETFMDQMVQDIKTLVKHATKNNMIPAVRLNGTSDIIWEKVSVTIDGELFPNLMSAFPTIQFYDYTKILGRKSAFKLSNYHLTFSRSESNDSEVDTALNTGYNVAVVFNIKPDAPKPLIWKGYPVVDGDETDIRFNNGSGNIIALTAKGKARKDTSGFVVDILE
jgi:hypothetical protein